MKDDADSTVIADCLPWHVLSAPSSHELDRVCAVCGARRGAHRFPSNECPDGEAWRRGTEFEPSERFDSAPDQLLEDRILMHSRVRPVYRARRDADEKVVGFVLVNMPEIIGGER